MLDLPGYLGLLEDQAKEPLSVAMHPLPFRLIQKGILCPGSLLASGEEQLNRERY